METGRDWLKRLSLFSQAAQMARWRAPVSRKRAANLNGSDRDIGCVSVSFRLQFGSYRCRGRRHREALNVGVGVGVVINDAA